MIIMIAIKCNGCGVKLKDTRGFKSHCISKHDGHDVGYTRLDQESKQDDTVAYIETDSSITTSNNSSMGNMDEAKDLTEHSIKIIDGTIKESKSTIKEIVEIATSEQFMPITMALLQGLANLANGHLNKQESKGMIKTQGGLEYEDF